MPAVHGCLARSARLVLALVALVGCDPDDGSGTTGGLPGSTPKPMVSGVVPTQVSAGDEIQIIGSNFCQPTSSCRTRVTFEGSFQGPGGPEPVQVEAQGVEVQNAGTLSWRFGPNIPFSRLGQIGSFSGTVKVFNEGPGGQGQVSSPQPVQMVVGPSIVIRRMGPLDGNCGGGGLTDTTENTSIIIDAEAVGLQPGSPGAPLMFAFSLSGSSFELEGRFSDRFGSDPDEVQQRGGIITLLDRVESGSSSTAGGSSLSRMRVLEQGLPAANSGSDLFDYIASNFPGVDYGERFAVNGLRTRPPPEGQGSDVTATISIQAVDSVGTLASRTVALRVWSMVELRPGETRPVRDFEPVPVSGCIVGLSPPLRLTYSDARTETKQRSVASKIVAKPQFGMATSILAGLAASHAQIEAELGIQLDEVVSSAQLNGSSVDGEVLPGQVAVIYRQLHQREQRLDAIVHTACGQAEEAGYFVLTDWAWGTNLARAKQQTCDPMPKSQLVAKEYGSRF